MRLAANAKAKKPWALDEVQALTSKLTFFAKFINKLRFPHFKYQGGRMSMAVCGPGVDYRPSLIAFFGDSVNMVFQAIEEVINEIRAQIAAQKLEYQKKRLLKKGRELGRILGVIAENDIPLSREAVSGAREIARWIEGWLNGDDSLPKLNEEQYAEFRKIYISIAGALSTILILEEMRCNACPVRA